MFRTLRPRGLHLPNVDRVVGDARQRDVDGRWRMHDKPRWRPFRVVPGQDVEAVRVLGPLEHAMAAARDFERGMGRVNDLLRDAGPDHPGWDRLAADVRRDLDPGCDLHTPAELNCYRCFMASTEAEAAARDAGEEWRS